MAARANLAALLVVPLLWLPACGGTETWEARGVVRTVSPSEHRISIEHGDIEGLMSAMTMDLAVYETELLEGLEVGAEIDFTLRRAGNGYALVRWRPTPSGAER